MKLCWILGLSFLGVTQPAAVKRNIEDDLEVGSLRTVDGENDLIAPLKRLLLQERNTKHKEDVCTSGLGDIVFVADSSGSIGPDRWHYVVQFLQDVVSGLDIGLNTVQVGLVKFSGSTELEFHLNQHTSKAGLLDAISKVQYMGGETHTAEAIKTMGAEFQSSNGDRAGAPNIGIVVTDGNSISRRNTEIEANLAKAHGVHMIAIGIGQSIDMVELKAIASDSDSILSVADIQRLHTIIEPLLRVTCTAMLSTAVCDATSPCLNGAVCQMNASRTEGYVCQCTVGFSGAHCETVICDHASPCQNGAVCQMNASNSDGYVCQCMAGFFGIHCDRAICDVSTTCLNGAVCQMNASSSVGFVCLCAVGFSGTHCEKAPLYICDLLEAYKGKYRCTGCSSDGHEPKDSCTLTCDTSYHLIGPSTITCLTNGQWNDRHRCVHNEDVSNVHATYNCDDRNPCTEEHIQEELFHWPHADPRKFVQCDEFGLCFVMPCELGTTWDPVAVTCNFDEGMLPEIPSYQHTYNCDDRNPCTEENIQEGLFHWPHADPRKFVQCDEYGLCFVMPCELGTTWDPVAVTCNFEEEGLPEIPSYQHTYNCDDRNPCTEEHIQKGLFHWPHADPMKFVQCDEYGLCFVMPCGLGTTWDPVAETCNFDEGDTLNNLE